MIPNLLQKNAWIYFRFFMIHVSAFSLIIFIIDVYGNHEITYDSSMIFVKPNKGLISLKIKSLQSQNSQWWFKIRSDTDARLFIRNGRQKLCDIIYETKIMSHKLCDIIDDSWLNVWIWMGIEDRRDEDVPNKWSCTLFCDSLISSWLHIGFMISAVLFLFIGFLYFSRKISY